MSNIAIIGVTGDPPTRGHAWLANQAMRDYYDEIWLMPCLQHKLGKNPVEFSHRFRMCEIMAKEIGIKASPWEKILSTDGTALATYTELKSLYREDNLVWVIGLDNALSIDKWAHADRLKAGEVPFLVCGRGGYECPSGEQWFQKPPHRYIEGANWEWTSSTSFKELYPNDPSYKFQVTSGVLQYIQSRKLYLRGQK